MLEDDYAYLDDLAGSNPASLVGVNLLLVEDNPINSLVAAGLLQHAGADGPGLTREPIKFNSSC